jgi:proteasome accessory factor A
MLDLLEINALPQIALGDAVVTLRALSRTLRPPWRVTLADGRAMDALELLESYRQTAHSEFHGRDKETDSILKLWADVIVSLNADPESLIGMLDWVSKEYLMKAFCEQEGLEWSDPWLESQDLEFHHIHPDRSLGLPMANLNGVWSPHRLDKAKLEPPTNSRAHARSRLMREIQELGGEVPYYLDWEAVEVGDQERTQLLNPFQP